MRNQSFSAKMLYEARSSVFDLSTLLNSAKSATSAYGKSLDSFTFKIPDHSNQDDLNSILRTILSETGKMVERTVKLEMHLDQVSHKLGELGQYLEKANREAMTDGLTGIANRRAFDEQIAASMEDAIARKSPLAILFIDIDHFKKFNDIHGHTTGDQVLRLVSSLLVRNIKTGDMGARYGGEEFAIILPGVSLKNGLSVADRLRRVIENKVLVDRQSDKNLGQITLSIGVAQYCEGEDVSSFIKRADAALYEAKRTGRNRVCAASV